MRDRKSGCVDMHVLHANQMLKAGLLTQHIVVTACIELVTCLSWDPGHDQLVDLIHILMPGCKDGLALNPLCLGELAGICPKNTVNQGVLLFQSQLLTGR